MAENESMLLGEVKDGWEEENSAEEGVRPFCILLLTFLHLPQLNFLSLSHPKLSSATAEFFVDSWDNDFFAGGG